MLPTQPRPSLLVLLAHGVSAFIILQILSLNCGGAFRQEDSVNIAKLPAFEAQRGIFTRVAPLPFHKPINGNVVARVERGR
jgi:hypothetical protein